MDVLQTRKCVKAAKPSRAARRGVAVVELALVAPLLVMIVMGLIEVGRAVTVQQDLTNASREGARVAGNDSIVATSAVQAAVDNYLSGAGINGATTVVSPSDLSSVSDGQPVTVTVSIPYSQVSWLPASWFMGGATLTATTVMTRQPSP